MRKIILLFILSLLSGCVWFGVETMTPIEKEVQSLNSWQVNQDYEKYEVVEVGDSKVSVVQKIGNPVSIDKTSEYEIWNYPSTIAVKDGKTICLGWLPIPLRKKTEGKNLIYFGGNNKVYKIIQFTTEGKFHGVYTDDSGSGVLNGEKSKCGI